jgi:hypothetical protein
MDANGNISVGNLIVNGDLTVVPGDIIGNVTGNLSGNVVGNVTGNLAGNVTGNLAGNVTGNLTGIVTGSLIGNVTGNLTGIVTGSLIGDVTGNLVGNSITANYFLGGNISGNGAGITSVPASSITGTISPASLSGTYNIDIAGSSVTAATVTASSQPNITSVGTLSSLVVSTGISAGTMNVTGAANAGSMNVTGVANAGSIRTPNINAGATGTAGTITGQWSLTPGSRLTATYADLAERQHSDTVYPVGTVMTVGGVNEVTAATNGDRILGVVSTEYAFLMNGEAGNDNTHPAVAYLGRVPVRVIGPINKHDPIALDSDSYGVARASAMIIDSFGWALETNTDSAEKLVLCIIK